MSMKKRIFEISTIAWALVVAFAMTSCAGDELRQPDLQGEEPMLDAPYHEGVLLVKFSSEVADMIASQPETRSGMSLSGVPSLDEVLAILGNYRLERLYPLDERVEERTREAGMHQWYVVRFDERFTASEVAASLSALGEVQQVNYNRTIKRAYTGKATPLKVEDMPAVTRSANNDPLLEKQWNLINRGDLFTEGEVVKSVKDADVQCEKAWERSMGHPEVIVAVLDEGIFVEHPDLAENMWVNEDEIAGSREDNDNNGYAGDVNGYNFVHGTGRITWNDVMDSGHGSHVAGVIAAKNRNGEGVASIAGGDGSPYSGVKVMACQIFSGNMSTGLIEVLRAMKYAADNGAVILQCSWGYVSGAANIYDWGEAGFATEEEWMAGSPLEKAALEYFRHNAGSPNGPIDGGIAVYAAGNESAPMAGYPGAAEPYVSVAATAADFTPAVYTNYGPGTTISAPGGDQDYYYDYVDSEHNYGEVGCILSLLPYHVAESGYGYMEGTSMACPHVSGVLALGVAHAAKLRRHFKADELRDLLYATAVNIDSYMVGSKKYCRYVADVGPIRPMLLDMTPFAGQMGAGQINAEAFLAAIEGAGVEMRFPNLTISEEQTISVSPARYFVEGEQLTYTVNIANSAIAKCEPAEGKLLFKALQSGSTTATITASNGVVHSFTITVRKNSASNGWL